MTKKINVAVVGASGMVGGQLLGLLESRRFPVGEFYPFNSGRRPAEVAFKGKKYACLRPSLGALKKADLVFFVSTDEVSAKFAARLAAAGVWCIDDSAHFRLAAGVPLVIPEVNGGELKRSKKLIAGPNCTITGAAVALAGIHRKFRVTELRLATYQAVSGAGRAAMAGLEKELKAYFKTGSVPARPEIFPRPIAFNLFPQVGGFDAEGRSGEENKVEAELKKLWNSPAVKISSTAVRVPVLRGHSLGIWAKTARPWTLGALAAELKNTPGLKFFPDAKNYPTPLSHGNKTFEVYAGRLRKASTAPREFQLWVVSDNLYKGAALNSVQIAERLLAENCFRGRGNE
ncbi:MAG TPA: aspartate-semialdehyde dehydrogenase [Elusimicrobiales bacterium]|nr:aspartate-semialdehyde dehydrogenase [Elusimicrobiales bacterium]